MPYILSPKIKENMSGMWLEGSPYSKKNIYSIDGSPPPVNYDLHQIKSHSLTHAEGSLHTQKKGKSIDRYFSDSFFFGKTTVVKLAGNNYKLVNKEKGIYLWEISLKELKVALEGRRPEKLIVSVQEYKKNCDGFHDPNYVLVLSLEAANWLVENEHFNLYGTSWKSSDFNPGSMSRPVHDTLFDKAVIIECLDLENVPSGDYFITSFPLYIEGASESPVTPVLFSKDEILNIF